MFSPHVIICAGEELAPRWDNYLGVTRHMVPTNEGPLIHRTQRQLISRNVKNISLACDVKRISEYLLPQVTHVELPPRTGDIRENSVTWAYRDYIKEDGSTIFLFGDTYYTDAIIDNIVENSTLSMRVYNKKPPLFVGNRFRPEILAIIINKEESKLYIDHIDSSIPKFLTLIKNFNHTPAGLSLFVNNTFWKRRKALGVSDFLSYRFYWDDITDDFDYPKDWDEKHRQYPNLFPKPL